MIAGRPRRTGPRDEARSDAAGCCHGPIPSGVPHGNMRFDTLP